MPESCLRSVKIYGEMKVQYYGVFTLTEIETDTEVPRIACIDLYGGVHTALRQQCHWVLSNLSVSVSVSGSVSVP